LSVKCGTNIVARMTLNASAWLQLGSSKQGRENIQTYKYGEKATKKKKKTASKCRLHATILLHAIIQNTIVDTVILRLEDPSKTLPAGDFNSPVELKTQHDPTF